MQKYIRNFSIIAHIDHGKSTLSKKIIQICTKKKINNKESIIDSMDLEKEKGITIKSHSVNLKFKYKKKIYHLNLIDTPGHTDFSFEVFRSLHACEGALLLIDATKGIQAQTLANFYVAKKLNLEIIPIINKIDISYVNTKSIETQIIDILKYKKKQIFYCSAKTGKGIKKIIKNIIHKIKPPVGYINKPLQAIIIDSYFNNYIGTVFFIKIINGFLKKNNKIKISNNKHIFNIEYIFLKKPKKIITDILLCGEIGWIVCKTKKTNYRFIGEIITSNKNKEFKKQIKFKQQTPQIYVSIYPLNNTNFYYFKKSLEKLILNDPSIQIKPEQSTLLGYGFRCGFLGLLHIEITKERLLREYNLDILITPPNVVYKIKNKKNKILYISNPEKIPNKHEIKKIKEPIAICNIICPHQYIGKIISMCNQKRGIQKDLIFFKNYVLLKYEIPISEIITNFSDTLKCISNGYASFNYVFLKFKTTNIFILEVLINYKKIKQLTTLIHQNNIKKYSENLIKTLKNNINKHQFNIVIQIVCNNKIIKSINIKSFRKNVISKCYGGDVSRKKKLLYKQKKGKQKMKKFGNVSLNKDIFFKIIKLNK